jgi:hypothetical protein
MKYLHIAIILDYEECLVDRTEKGLKQQVIDSLVLKSLTPPTDDEWEICVEAKKDEDIDTDNLALGMVTYYKIESKIGDTAALAV